MTLDGKIAMVTGGARRVGRAICMELARAGADVAIHYNRSAEDARTLIGEISAVGKRSEAFQADLTDPKQIEALFAAVKDAFGRVDVLVNNAAVYHRTPIDSLTADQWDAEFAVNARAPALCIRHVIGLLADGSAIINIVDIAAEKARPSFPAYCASKAALLALTKSVARALAPKVRVNAVSPGVALWPEGVTDERMTNVLDQVPMNRPGSPQDVAAAVVFLAQQDYITGQNLRVDGGWHVS